EVTEILCSDESFLWRRLHACTYFAKCTRSAAVLRVVYLNHKALRIAHEELRRSITRRYAHLHRAAAQSGIAVRGLRDSVLFQHADDAVRIEILDAHPDDRSDARRIRTGRGNGHELRTVSDAQKNSRAMSGLNGHAEEALIKIDGSLHIGYEQGELRETLHRNRWLGRLREEPRRQC